MDVFRQQCASFSQIIKPGPVMPPDATLMSAHQAAPNKAPKSDGFAAAWLER